MKIAKLLLLASGAFLLSGCNTTDIPSIPSIPAQDFNFGQYSVQTVNELLGQLQSDKGYEISIQGEFLPDVENPNVKQTVKTTIGSKGNYMWEYHEINGQQKLGYALFNGPDTCIPYYYDCVSWQKGVDVGISKQMAEEAIQEKYEALYPEEKYIQDIKNAGEKIGKSVVAGRDCAVFEFNSDYHVIMKMDKIFGIIMSMEVVVTNATTLVTSQTNIAVTSFQLFAEVPNFPQ